MHSWDLRSRVKRKPEAWDSSSFLMLPTFPAPSIEQLWTDWKGQCSLLEIPYWNMVLAHVLELNI